MFRQWLSDTFRFYGIALYDLFPDLFCTYSVFINSHQVLQLAGKRKKEEADSINTHQKKLRKMPHPVLL